MGCGCIAALIGASAPRIGFVFLWFFTNYVERAYDGFWIPLLGVLFLPYTALVYAFVAADRVLSPLNIVFLIIAVVVDLGTYGGGERARRS